MTSSWFYPNISGLEAKELLMERGFDGSYLTRHSNSNPGAFTLSIRRKDEVTHIKIQNQGDFYDLYGGEKFATLAELVHYYTKCQGELKEKNGQLIALKYPLYNQDITTERWYHGNITSKVAEELLMMKGRSGSFLVRESTSSPGDYVFSIKNNENSVTHVKIHSQDNKFDLGGGEKFDTLPCLVEHYKVNPMVEVSGSVLHLKQPLNATRIMASAINNRFIELDKSHVTKAGFCEEFERLNIEESRSTYNRQAGNQPENRAKNRYKNIRPTDETRVILTDADLNIPGCDYINANFIYSEIDGELRKSYIATQSCLPNTIKDFWRMVWCHDCRIIVMLTKLVEKGKGKCSKYWPEDTVTHEIPDGFLKVTRLKTERLPDYELREFELTKITCHNKNIITKFYNNNNHSCTTTNNNHNNFDSYGRFRRDSDLSWDMVESSLGDLSLDTISLNTITDKSTILSSLSDINSINSVNNLNNIGVLSHFNSNTDFNNINAIGGGCFNDGGDNFSLSSASNISSLHASHAGNIEGFTNGKIHNWDPPTTLPPSPSQSSISSSASNQPLIPPKSERRFPEQTPDSQNPPSNLPQNSPPNLPQNSPPNLPQNPASAQPPPNTDALPPPQPAKEYTIERRVVHHYLFTSWPDTFVPKDPGPVLTLLQDMHDRQDSIDNPGPIIVHCSAGIGRTGTLIVIDLLRNQIRYQGINCDIDIPRTIVKARSYRSGLVQSECQYRFIYQAVCHYVQTISLMIQDHKNQRLGHDYHNIRYSVESNLLNDPPTASQTSINSLNPPSDNVVRHGDNQSSLGDNLGSHGDVKQAQQRCSSLSDVSPTTPKTTQSCRLYGGCIIANLHVNPLQMPPQPPLQLSQPHLPPPLQPQPLQPQQQSTLPHFPMQSNKFPSNPFHQSFLPSRSPKLLDSHSPQQNYENL